MRPAVIERFTHFDRTQRIIRLSRWIEGFDWKKLLGTLPLHKPNYGKQNAFEMSRVTRDTVLHKLMYGQDFTAELARFAYDCYGLRLAGDNTGYKSFKQIRLFVQNFILHPNPSITMENQSKLTPDTREQAYNLGTSVGIQIMNPNNDSFSADDRARAGRKYMVQINKSRTYKDVLSAIGRLTIKYQDFKPKKELIQKLLTEDNFESVKHLIVIGAMTYINSKLTPRSVKETTTENL
jgi:hypothetical protein